MSVKTLWPDDVARATPDISKITEMCVERRELCGFVVRLDLAFISHGLAVYLLIPSMSCFQSSRCCNIIVKIFVAFSGLPFGGLR